MKISLNWLLEHIATPVKQVDVGLIAAKFNIHTAEIEHYQISKLDSVNLFLVRIIAVQTAAIVALCKELEITVSLPYRNDVQVGDFVFVRKFAHNFGWEKLSFYNPAKEGLFPAVDCPLHDFSGSWRENCEEIDYILDVDNKSINHRPDLWGHRGIAGEVAAFMGWQLKPLDSMLAQIQTAHESNFLSSTAEHQIAISIENSHACARLAVLHCHEITHKASQIWMAIRLARIDSKPINSIVDITNYVMFDISQPMHVFDAANFKEQTLVARNAQQDETLELLDGQVVKLTNQDIVITDGHIPVALAGVMGGRQASFSSAATSIIIESGSFHAAMVRTTAARLKIQTEACMRFAKQLDPMQNITALLRFVYLAQGIGVVQRITEKIASVGVVVHPSTIVVHHSFIEQRLGVELSHQIVVDILRKLEFIIVVEKHSHDTFYHVTIPTLRMTKDITIAEDIVEEVVRIYGFANISYKRPVRQMRSFDMSSIMRLRALKAHCAFALGMQEVRDYLFYDESFLRRLDWYPDNAVAIKNPVSENWKVLVTSLIPHLLKNVELNSHIHESINFFECNTIWSEKNRDEALETKAFAGIFAAVQAMSFYDYKAMLQSMFATLHMSVVWEKSHQEIEPWFERTQVADLFVDGVKIGRAGMLSQAFTRTLFKHQGFSFELYADKIIQYKPTVKQFKPWSKYQAVSVDISMLVDATMTAQTIGNLIYTVDHKIDNVMLVDFFEKDEWNNKRSLTFRYRICDFEHNVTKDVIDAITHRVITTMQNIGAVIR